MGQFDPARRGSSPQRRSPGLEALEGRRLMAASAANTPYVTQNYAFLMDDLRRREANSRATPAEYLALRDDARAVSAATAATSLVTSDAEAAAENVTAALDRSTVDGALGQPAWAAVQTRLTANLDGLGVPQTLIDQTVADMKAVATSARVTPAEYQTFTTDFNNLVVAERTPSSPSYGDTPAELYFAQHLGGFFRGWAVQRTSGVATLNADVRSIPSIADSSAAGAAAVRRDARDLETLGGKITGAADDQLQATYLAAFQAGNPTPGAVAQLPAELTADLGVSPTPAQVKQVDQLASDAPAFYQAVGSSAANAGRIVADVRAVVDTGVAAAPNPFKVTVAARDGG